MSKKIVVISLLLAGLLLVSIPAQAQLLRDPLPALPSAGLTPNSPFYFLEVIAEAVGEFLTFDAEAKAELQVARALERVAEIKAMLDEAKVNTRGLSVAFDRLKAHADRAAEITERIKQLGEDVEALTAKLDTGFDLASQVLDAVLEESEEKLEETKELAEQELEKKFADPAFAQAMEEVLMGIASAIDEELGKPLDGFTVIEDESNVDVDDDTYSATHRAESPILVDLETLRDRVLARGVEKTWESGDVVLDDDSLDITFEKTYGEVDIMGEILFPYASVTISVTQNSPRTGMTAINYDIDITLESESEHLLDFLEDLKEDIDDDLGALSDVMKDDMNPKEAAERFVIEIEKEQQEMIADARKDGVQLLAGDFAEFDNLLPQAKSMLQAGNYDGAVRLVKLAEKSLDKAEQMIEKRERELEKEKEKEKEKVERIKEKEDRLEQQEGGAGRRMIDEE